MTGSSYYKLLTCALGVALALVGSRRELRGDEQRIVGIADCTFSVNPDRFLAQESRVRDEIARRVSRLGRPMSPQGWPASVPASAIPQRNFIDQEIFGNLIQQNLPSAGLSSDTEFLRRVYLDLTGKPPSSDDIRAFLDDTSDNKRDAVIDKLLYSAEFTDKWTMWLGDLLQNTATLNSVNFNRNIQGRNAFFSYIQDAIYNEKSFRDIAFEVISGGGNNYDVGTANFPMAGSTAMGPIQDTYDNMLVRSATIFLGLSYYDCLLCHNGRGHLDQISLWGSGYSRNEAQQMAAFFARTRFNRYPENQVQGQTPSYYFQSYTVDDAAAGTYDLNTTFGNRPNRTPIGTVRNLTPSYRVTGAAPPDNSWRVAFAKNLIRDPLFAVNLANRIWKQLFNMGLVEPVETLDPARLDPNNPPPAPWSLQPAQPVLLQKLANQFSDLDYHLRPFIRVLVQSSAYQLSSHYDGQWSAAYLSSFARHYARRLEGEEVHDEIAKATGVLGNYSVQYWADRVNWAMKLPEPVEPRSDGNTAAFMNTFFRGNRDNQTRMQAGSIQQQLYLMNDAFVTNRTKVAASPKLKAIVQLTNNDDVINETYLTFLSRYPSDYERGKAQAFLSKANTAALRNNAVEDLAWVCINKIEFLFSY